MTDEPKFVRRERAWPFNWQPRCGRCGKALERSQVRWCSAACRACANRWARELNHYWDTK
jgi:hypothetical protein